MDYAWEPVCCREQAIAALLDDFEIDFLSLSFVREADDLHAARDFLDSIGATTTKARRLFACSLHHFLPAHQDVNTPRRVKR